MFRIFFSIILLVLTVNLFAQEKAAKYDYVGVSKCKTCHKKESIGAQYLKWKESKHAKAFEALKTEEAAKIAQEKGLKVPAYEAPECLKCHTTGFGEGGYEVKDEAFWKPAEGDNAARKAVKRMTGLQAVTCETCHGPGSGYKKKKIMKDREVAIKNGLNPISVADGTAEKLCKTCHNEESPTYKEFIFKERWEKIAHPVPEKTKG